MQLDHRTATIAPRLVHESISIAIQSCNFCADAEILRDALRFVRALNSEAVQVFCHLIRRHAVAVIDNAELVLFGSTIMFPVNVPTDEAFDSILLLTTANRLERVLGQLADLLIRGSIGGK